MKLTFVLGPGMPPRIKIVLLKIIVIFIYSPVPLDLYLGIRPEWMDFHGVFGIRFEIKFRKIFTHLKRVLFYN